MNTAHLDLQRPKIDRANGLKSYFLYHGTAHIVGYLDFFELLVKGLMDYASF